MIPKSTHFSVALFKRFPACKVVIGFEYFKILSIVQQTSMQKNDFELFNLFHCKKSGIILTIISVHNLTVSTPFNSNKCKSSWINISCILLKLGL